MITNKDKVYILGIESSCDETSVAVLRGNKMLSNVICTQEVHANYGGVVPELASRAHMKNIVPVVDEALKKAGINKEELSAIAFTRGPGLMGALLVGVSFAKSLALGLDIPLIEVNHMEAHILAHFIEMEGRSIPECPFICLTVSGGHTQIVKVNSPLSFEILGETLDDAAGEAFDKGAKLMGLPYPGGPHIDKQAREGNPLKYEFTKPSVPGYNYSFSGLKTALLYFLEDGMKQNPNFIQEHINDICASYQHVIVDYLLDKVKAVLKAENINRLAIAGGVSANSYLRNALKSLAEENGMELYIPEFQFCTDNGAMIAMAGYFKYQNKIFSNQAVTPKNRMALQK
ncbi:tRNA (adenosine(37)-N6)-threonylcarbamoyltransferase complex transferase subunit TsaD [Luteibaculum oceani]|uniref:tRNA N6-adenosine threonylcarbamoyltransferase n=1 Tax=Luteibaculum oceani TaxID=1294296 RepID=A0A5C6UTY0_9FLAO|nr:tRNA (adenosine(37)-N6)-threonylcarbamoyltransferase complex transferase subunit TsaD [Luteibaculum oceani]TXC76084.1 tRNA (adenosine(37)-N6)-threonylcarbamoyltransferase complex transferase subunit TsaD [Luteibaculum oceani]